MKKIIFTSLFLLGIFFINEASAQKYSSAVGIRGGYYITGTYKKFLTESNAAEAYLGIAGFGGFVAGLQYQIHKPLEIEELGIDNLDWYFGGGAYAGTWAGYYSGNSFFAGINGVLGLDYKFDEFPINVSVDWMPGVNILKGDYAYRFHSYGGGVAIRYILGE